MKNKGYTLLIVCGKNAGFQCFKVKDEPYSAYRLCLWYIALTFYNCDLEQYLSVILNKKNESNTL